MPMWCVDETYPLGEDFQQSRAWRSKRSVKVNNKYKNEIKMTTKRIGTKSNLTVNPNSIILCCLLGLKGPYSITNIWNFVGKRLKIQYKPRDMNWIRPHFFQTNIQFRHDGPTCVRSMWSRSPPHKSRISFTVNFIGRRNEWHNW